MTTHVRCGTLFAGNDTATQNEVTVGVSNDGLIRFVCPTAEAPSVAEHDSVLDYSKLFVMPGLIDVHTHTWLTAMPRAKKTSTSINRWNSGPYERCSSHRKW
jgi:cytosine/adenosine deaminase-related metal-dependent hydrolase